MIFRFAFLFALLGWLWSGSSRASAATDNPYTPIVGRNVFGLLPIPTNNPAEAAPATPPPKITPNGIMTLFGKLQVLFKVAGTPKPGQPPKDESYVLGVGERQDDIEVQKIDEPSATIKFNNHGTVQELSLVPGTASGGGGPGAIPAPTAFGGMPVPGAVSAISAPGGGVVPSFGGRFGRARDAASVNSAYGGGGVPNPASTGGINFGSRNTYANAPKQETTLTPEAQVIMMEVNRLATQDQVTQGVLPPLPPTPITPEDATGVGGAPLISPPPPPPPLPGSE